jgi:hypothetical protein
LGNYKIYYEYIYIIIIVLHNKGHYAPRCFETTYDDEEGQTPPHGSPHRNNNTTNTTTQQTQQHNKHNNTTTQQTQQHNKHNNTTNTTRRGIPFLAVSKLKRTHGEKGACPPRCVEMETKCLSCLGGEGGGEHEKHTQMGVFFVFEGMGRGRTCKHAQTDVFYMFDGVKGTRKTRQQACFTCLADGFSWWGQFRPCGGCSLRREHPSVSRFERGRG